ncbi:hypothetical protein GGU11DRAFT_752393 [Lentinula aff. detonsa]|nr:hypothetical protein GGU11DRAFT_752393 [Lentinula aff. detonsa]
MTKQLLELTQVVNKMVDGQLFKPFDPSIGSTDSQVRKPKLCYWDGWPARTMNDCPDLAEWVRNGTVERNARGHVVLKGSGRLLDEERFNRGPIKQQFEKYFEEYPAAGALILDIPSNQDVGPNRQLGEPDFVVSTCQRLDSFYTKARHHSERIDQKIMDNVGGVCPQILV